MDYTHAMEDFTAVIELMNEEFEKYIQLPTCNDHIKKSKMKIINMLVSIYKRICIQHADILLSISQMMDGMLVRDNELSGFVIHINMRATGYPGLIEINTSNI